MDQETTRYIRRYYSHLLLKSEREAVCLESIPEAIKAYGKDRWHKHFIEGGFINKDNALGLLVKDLNALETAFAERTLALRPDRIFLNFCQKCNQLARTPKAKQCRHCGYSWHHLTVTTMKLDGLISITNRAPVLVAEFLNHQAIEIGQFVNLTTLGRNRHAKIEGIEIITKYEDKVPKGLPALVLPSLNNEDIEWLKRTELKGQSFEILQEGWLY